MMDQAKATEIVKSLTVADILQAYSGKPGCACGCNGSYRVTPESRKEADESRGYPHDDSDVNASQVKRVLNYITLAAASDPFEADIDRVDRQTVCWNVADDLQYVTATVRPTRVYTVYLTKAARTSRGVTEGYGIK